MRSTAFQQLNKLLCLLLSVVLLGLLCIGVWAQPEARCQLTIDYRHKDVPIPHAAFRLYRIADLSGDQDLSYTGAFSDLKLDAEALADAASDLYARVEAQGLRPEHTLTTDSQGNASVSDLMPGAFLLVGDPVTVNGYVYYLDKQVIFLEEDTLTLHPKSTRLPEQVKLICVQAVKVWDDQGYENQRPNAIVVRLLKDGKTFSSAVLSKENNWTHTWNNLLPNARWTVEEDVPQGYKVSVAQEGYVFTLTNHRKDIPQTGYIWWPVITALCLGLALIAVGMSVRRSGRNEA